MPKNQPPEEPQKKNTADAAEEFLKNLTSTFDDDQQKKGLTDLAQMFWDYYVALQTSGFHRTKAFVLCRDWHGMWWSAKINHEMMHMHQGPEPDEDSEVG